MTPFEAAFRLAERGEPRPPELNAQLTPDEVLALAEYLCDRETEKLKKEGKER